MSMRRLLAVAAILYGLGVPAAGAATVGVYDGPDLTAVALAGPDAVVLRQVSGERSRLVAVARGGGKPQTVLTVDRMNLVFEDESRRLAASAARVALIAEIVGGQDRTVAWRVYSGPPRGPIGVVRALPVREAWVPSLVDVDGDRALIVEARPEPDGPIRAFVLDSAAGLVPISWARASALPVEISGPFAAASMAGPNRVSVLDLATGAELATVALSDRERGTDLGLAPDGRVAVATRAGVKVAGPGAVARLVPGTRGLSRVHLAGGTLSGIDETGRAVALPVGGGPITSLGPPTGVFVDAAGDAAGYAWIANGCVRVAAIAVSTASTRPSGSCPTTEIAYASIASTRLRGRTITVPISCVAAPRGVCRGTAIGRIFEGDGKAAATGRFAIAVGTRREVKLRVTRAALAEFRREGDGHLVMDARIPNGRIGVGADGTAELTVHLPGRG